MNVLGLIILGIVFNAQRQEVLADTKGCERRYMRRINGKCYYFSVKKLNWFGALNNCLRKGLVLADLGNAQDFQKVIDFLSSKGNTEDFWFSGNDLQHEGRYQYISNGRLVHYFSNNSLIEPAEHSDCNDCLEVRIRENTTVVSDDNCLERQYFICSERYCDNLNDNKKKRHHSHEHLHHFHHDIGSGSDDYDNVEPGGQIANNENTIEPEAPVSPDGQTTAQTEEANGDGTWGEKSTGEAAPATEGAEGAEAPAAEGAETPAAEGAEAPAAEGAEAPAAEETPAAEGAEAPAAAAEETPAAEGAEAPAAEETPAAEGAEAPAAEGAEAPAAEAPADATPPAEGAPADAAPPAEGAADAAAPPPAEGTPDAAAPPPAEGTPDAAAPPKSEERNGEGAWEGKKEEGAEATEAPAA